MINIRLTRDLMQAMRKDSSVIHDYVHNRMSMIKNVHDSSDNNLTRRRRLKKKSSSKKIISLSEECRKDPLAIEAIQQAVEAYIMISLTLTIDQVLFDPKCQVVEGTNSIYCDHTQLSQDLECINSPDEQWVLSTVTYNDFDDDRVITIGGIGACLPMSCDPVEVTKFLSSPFNVVPYTTKSPKSSSSKKSSNTTTRRN